MNKEVKYFKTFKELRDYRKGITKEIKPIEVKEEPKKAIEPEVKAETPKKTKKKKAATEEEKK